MKVEVDVPNKDLPKMDVPNKDVPNKDVPNKDVPNKDVPNKDLPKKDVPNKDLPNKDVPNKDVPNKDLPNKDVPNKDLPKKDLPKKDLPNKDLPNKDLPDKDLPNKDVPNKPTVSVDVKQHFIIINRLDSRRLSFLFKKGEEKKRGKKKEGCVCGHCLVTLSLTVNETLRWLSSLPVSMQESFWGWQCSDRYMISFFAHLHTSSHPVLVVLNKLMVSVDGKHHV